MTIAYMVNQEYVTFDNTIIVNSLGKQHRHANVDAVYKLLRTFNYKDITKEFLKERVNEPVMQDKIRISLIETKTLTKSMKTADFVTFTEEILNGKLHFLCSL